MESPRPRPLAALVPPILALVAVAVLVAACASGPRVRYRHEYSLAPGQEHRVDQARALLVPIDYTNEDRVGGLEVANDRITDLIVDHLEAKGISVERPDPVRFRTVATAAQRAAEARRKSGASGVVASSIGFADVVPQVLASLESDAQLVVDPNVVLRVGTWNGGSTMVWDGVRRRDRTAGAGSTYGTGRAASLEVAVHDREGQTLFSGIGGLDLVFQFNLQARKMETRENLLADDENLAEGICVAFYPYFGFEESCAR